MPLHLKPSDAFHCHLAQFGVYFWLCTPKSLFGFLKDTPRGTYLNVLFSTFLRRQAVALSSVKVKQVKPQAKAFKLFDEDGLYLKVTPNGQRYWRMKYRFNRK